MAGKSPSALANFSHDWIGGDIHGLSALAGTLYGYGPQMEDVTSFLNGSVNKVAHDAGWSGSAASSFEEAWETDAMASQALEGAIGSAADIIDTLAVNLAAIESALEDAADQAKKAGLPVGEDGKPPTGPVPGTAQQMAGDYSTFWTESLQLADQARTDAAGQLQQVYQQIAPPGAAGTQTLSTGDQVTVGDYLRGLWAVPSAYSKVVGDQAQKAEADAVAAKKAWTEAKNARPNPRVPIPQDAKDALRSARDKLKATDARLATAESAEGKTLLSKALDVRVSTFFSGMAAEADAAGDISFLKKAVKFGGEIPVIDILATGAGTFFGARDDMQKGMPWYEAVPENALSNIGGLAAGAAVGTAVGAGVAAMGFAGATVGGVVAGAVVGGVVCVGVGDFATNLFHEHWDEDIHKDGVVLGVADGVGHSVVNTGKDLANMGKKIWHSIF
ncbi:hypothetical protein ACFYNO_07785 [Kitasatospora sp. NPDC006697]|uniref:hypothetical protein n=1 Tax=Kitasatospora sp. NPDC006697 TaxID=3364020 RepID=UPI0036BDE31E